VARNTGDGTVVADWRFETIYIELERILTRPKADR